MQTYEGIYENGVVRFATPLVLPEHTKVVVTVEVTATSADHSNAEASSEQTSRRIGSNSKELYELLSERFCSGFADTAARHNEHQP